MAEVGGVKASKLVLCRSYIVYEGLYRRLSGFGGQAESFAGQSSKSEGWWRWGESNPRPQDQV